MVENVVTCFLGTRCSSVWYVSVRYTEDNIDTHQFRAPFTSTYISFRAVWIILIVLYGIISLTYLLTYMP